MLKLTSPTRIGVLLPFHALRYTYIRNIFLELAFAWIGENYRHDRSSRSVCSPSLVPHTHLSSGVPNLDTHSRRKDVPIIAVYGRLAKSNRNLSAEHSRVQRLANRCSDPLNAAMERHMNPGMAWPGVLSGRRAGTGVLALSNMSRKAFEVCSSDCLNSTYSSSMGD
ncbi:hypothetical protein RSAG8_13418, partial [Rhizoctonia solani AG-8 WAC10335]